MEIRFQLKLWFQNIGVRKKFKLKSNKLNNTVFVEDFGLSTYNKFEILKVLFG